MGEEAGLLLNVAEHFPAKINSTSSMAAVKLIKEKLTEAQLSLFRSTCFGKLLEMNDIKNIPLIILYRFWMVKFLGAELLWLYILYFCENDITKV